MAIRGHQSRRWDRAIVVKSRGDGQQEDTQRSANLRVSEVEGAPDGNPTLRTRQPADARADGDLAAEAAAGSTAAFEELYRRHAAAAWRVATAVAGNQEDAADAVSDAFVRVFQALPAGRLEDASMFRSYLLSATRNAAIDQIRRRGRLEHVENADTITDVRPLPAPGERVDDRIDAALVAAAFRALPERWRSVLWLTEVEGMPPREAAELLGVSANNAAQLAVRARAGLRERFVQAHLRGEVPAECRACVDRLGAYVTGSISPRDLAKVDQHLAGCEECRARREELEDVGGVLRRVVVPLPLVLGSATLAKWRLASAAKTATSSASSTGRLGGSAVTKASLIEKVQKPLLATSTGLFALGIIAATAVSSPASPRGVAVPTRTVPPAVATQPAQVAPQQTIQLAVAHGPQVSGFDTGIRDTLAAATPATLPPTQNDAVPSAAVGSTPASTPAAAPASPALTDSAPASGGGDGAGPDPAPAPADPLVGAGVGVQVGGEPIGLTASISDAPSGGVEVGPVAAGDTTPEAPGSTAGVTVDVSGTVLPTGAPTSTSLGL